MKAQEHARRLLGSAIDDLHLMDPATPPPPPPPPIPDLKAQVILWRLSELNFRFELLALHERAGPADTDAVKCDEAVHMI